MEISILHPTTCGFARIIAYELINLQLPLEKQIEKYNIIFEECQEKFQVTLDTYKRNFPKIVAKIPAIGKRQKELKHTLLAEFSIKSWGDLSSLKTFFIKL